MQKSEFRQAKLLEEIDKEVSSDELIYKDKEILTAEEKLKRKMVLIHIWRKIQKAAEMFEEKERSNA